MTDSGGHPTTLLVGHARDTSSDHALGVAVDLGCRLGARLHVVHTICPDPYLLADGYAWDRVAPSDALVAEERRHVENLLAETSLPWSYEARHGDPATELARAAAAQDALMIIVGTRGEGLRRALARLVDPSVSHAVIGRQHRPVLVVPLPDARGRSY